MNLMHPLISMLLIISVLLLTAPTQAAQLYQWKDAQGRVYYSDQQPPPSVKNATQKNFKGSFIEGGDSFAMKTAREKFPVTLYSTACGVPCDQAKRHLEQRGVPYASKNPESGEDRAALLKLTGRSNVPVLVVGKDKIDGYEVGQWDAALDKAGYPKAGDLLKKPAPETTADANKTPAPGAPAKEAPTPAATPPTPAKTGY